MSKKDLTLKLWLVSKGKKARRVPLFVVAKTARRVQSSKFSRNWRRDKLNTRYQRKNLRKKGYIVKN